MHKNNPQPAKSPEEKTSENRENRGNVTEPCVRLRPGMLCPRCHSARIDYDSLLHLVCPECGFAEVGACT